MKIEFLSDLADAPSQSTVTFDGCETPGAVSLRGTGFAARDWQLRALATEVDGRAVTADVRVASLPAHLPAKTHAAYGRGAAKDWYDIAYVVLHNDGGGPDGAAARVWTVFRSDLMGQTRRALGELAANFVEASAQGTLAFAKTMTELHPDLDADVLANDAVAGMAAFLRGPGFDP